MAVGGAVTGKYVYLLVLVNSFFFVCSIYIWCFDTFQDLSFQQIYVCGNFTFNLFLDILCCLDWIPGKVKYPVFLLLKLFIFIIYFYSLLFIIYYLIFIFIIYFRFHYLFSLFIFVFIFIFISILIFVLIFIFTLMYISNVCFDRAHYGNINTILLI